jgi:hypothetical protein
MNLTPLIALPLLCLSALAAAATPPKAQLLDHSSEAVMDSATAKAILSDGIPARVWKLYAPSKWAFSSQVEGGITSDGTCVVTARVMMLPLTPTLKAVLFRPGKTATSFGAEPGASADQCKELAKTKLKESIDSVVSGLVKS